MRLLKKIKKGFTLVELVIVIAVIAVLAAVLIPVFGNVIKDARVSKLKADLNTCSSTLIMFAQYNDIDYYTPQNVKEFLISEGVLEVDESGAAKPILDGYSIWYNQRNFNLQLVENSKLQDYVSGGVVTAYADDVVVANAAEEVGASDMLDRLPRRLEAVTPNEDLLLMGTDNENISVIKSINKLYTLADDPTITIRESLNSELNSMQQIPLISAYQDSSKFDDYIHSFQHQNEDGNWGYSCAWLNNAGNWVVVCDYHTTIEGEGDPKTQYPIYKTIVTPELGAAVELPEGGTLDENAESSIKGNIIVDREIKTNAELNIQCTTEIEASKYKVKFEDSFYQGIYEGGAKVLISGNVNLQNIAASSHVSVSKVSTASGIASQITTAVNNGTGQVSTQGGNRFLSQTMSAEQFQELVTAGLVSIKNVSSADGKTHISVTLGNGKVEYTDVADVETFFQDNKLDGVSTLYKYNVPDMRLNVSGLMTKEGITGPENVYELNVSQTSYQGVVSTSVYLRYKKGDLVIGKTYRLGVGHITSFDHYYSYYSSNADIFANGFYENLSDKVYNDISATEGQLGYVGIKLPESALSLQAYKNKDFSIEVDYVEGTEYYKTVTSLSSEYEEHISTQYGSETKTLTLNKEGWIEKDGVFYNPFGIAAKTGNAPQEATSFVNTVKITRILIKDKDGNILIAKYPNA